MCCGKHLGYFLQSRVRDDYLQGRYMPGCYHIATDYKLIIICILFLFFRLNSQLYLSVQGQYILIKPF